MAAVHSIHVAGSQNGWERPAHDSEQRLLPSRRTKLGLRIPKARLADLKQALEGQTLLIENEPLSIGTGKERPLSTERTLFARYVIAAEQESEDDFLHRIAADLKTRGIKVRKALCGKALSLMTPEGPLSTRSLMLAELTPEESAELQRRGLGEHQAMGCGIFLPHKGIDAVAGPAQ
jgi:CRISPR-associated protein Cas6